MTKHSCVPDYFGHGIIIPLLKDEHGDSSKLEVYRGITLSPASNKNAISSSVIIIYT